MGAVARECQRIRALNAFVDDVYHAHEIVRAGIVPWSLIVSLARPTSIPEARWQVEQQPTWRNQLGWLEIDGRRLAITIETTPADHRPALEVSLHKQIA